MPNVGATTLATITLQAQQRADMVNSTFITASEWTGMVNASCQQLYEKMIEAYGSDYWVQTPYAFTTNGTDDKYALPTDFFKHLGTDLQLSNSASPNNGWISVWRFNFAARNQFTLPNVQTLWGRTNIRYRLLGGYIWLTPIPMAAQTLRIWYAPRFAPMTTGGDSFDGINGWEEWVVNDVAKKALVKSDEDISGVEALQAVQNDRLATIIDNRDAGMPATTVDVYRMNGWGGDGWSGDDWGP